jgi:hypothetical protein
MTYRQPELLDSMALVNAAHWRPCTAAVLGIA